MAIRKRRTTTGAAWGYYFDAPGSTRENRVQITGSGYASKREAQSAEAERRIQAQKEWEARARGVTAPLPKTLRELLNEFCTEHGDRNLAPKTVERYREQAAYIAPDLLAMTLDEITPLHLTREWNRLREAGGHYRKTKLARPLSAKTVRNIAGFVSSAFSQAATWGLVTANPVSASTRPRGGERRLAVALSPTQQQLLIDACNHWLLPTFLEVCAALGARRGEVLALRWSDLEEDQARIGRSLTQTRSVLKFKEPKTPAGYRTVTIPGSTLAILESHRHKQTEFREQFGSDYQSSLDLVFANPDGSPLRPDSISGTASALFRRLKLPKGASLHSLRHTHGSQLLAAGMELPAVSARLGHSSTHVTAKVYSHILDGRDREAAKVWDAIQGRTSETAPRQHAEQTGTKNGDDAELRKMQNERVRPN